MISVTYYHIRYGRTADFVVVEEPKAGGHLGFTKEEAMNPPDMDEEIKKIIAAVKVYGDRYGIHIPVIVAGGIYDKADIEHALSLGADGVQIASRFVATVGRIDKIVTVHELMSELM